ncbi:glycoside hydrolase family 25 protein, partial [Clostridium perfringens]
MLKGIDVSEHQGRIDWERVKGNIDFAILRAGYGRNNIDKQFIRNIEECNRLCIPVGIYWFSYAWNEEMARNEARYVLEAIKGYRVDYPISYDLEYDTLNYASKNGVTIGKRLATDMVKAFCDEINRNGYRAMNYTNQDFLLNKFYMNELTNYPLWYAWY